MPHPYMLNFNYYVLSDSVYIYKKMSDIGRSLEMPDWALPMGGQLGTRFPRMQNLTCYCTNFFAVLIHYDKS